tara:strand:+ start:244 stop:510 length:267 start_codon:yes stop_codon:yes gene_type:complete
MNRLNIIESHLNQTNDIEYDNLIIYYGIIKDKLKCDNYMKEFYEESPNWEYENIDNIINWVNMDYSKQITYLDNDLDNYFIKTYDGEF